MKVGEAFLKSQHVGETAHALTPRFAQWPQPRGIDVRMTNGHARGRWFMYAALHQFIERRSGFFHSWHRVRSVDGRVNVAQRVGDLGRARTICGQCEHESTHEIPRLRVTPSGLIDDHQLGALEATGIRLAPTRLQFGMIPPEG